MFFLGTQYDTERTEPLDISIFENFYHPHPLGHWLVVNDPEKITLLERKELVEDQLLFDDVLNCVLIALSAPLLK